MTADVEREGRPTRARMKKKVRPPGKEETSGLFYYPPSPPESVGHLREGRTLKLLKLSLPEGEEGRIKDDGSLA